MKIEIIAWMRTYFVIIESRSTWSGLLIVREVDLRWQETDGSAARKTGMLGYRMESGSRVFRREITYTVLKWRLKLEK
jgi:hypothetical protein